MVGFEEDREECLRLAGKVAYEKYVEMKERYENDERKDLEKFRIAMESYGERIKPRLRAELATSCFEIFIQFYTAFDEIGKNKMIMQNALYDEFVKHNINMPTPKIIHLD